MKTIMIIGAGKVQMPLIMAAKREGYRTIVSDLNPDALGVSMADVYCQVSTKDKDGLMEVARKNHINGIVANSEYAMCDMAYIAENLGLIGNSGDSISILSSKSRFRKLQKQIRLFAPRFSSGDISEQLDATDFSFPVIIKPDESSGSRGVTVIGDTNETAFRSSLSRAIKCSRNGKAIIEECVPIPSRSVIEGEIFINHGEILWDGLFQTIRSKTAPMLPKTYIFPLPEIEEKRNKVIAVLEKAFNAVGITHGEYNVELFFTNNGEPFIIEINPRQGGYELPKLVYEHCGIDFYRLLVTTSMGDDDYWDSLKKFKRKNRLIIHHMLFPRIAGRFMEIKISEDLRDKVYRCQLDVEAGDFVEGTVDSSSCIGCVDMEFDNTEDQLQTSLRIEDLISVEVV